MRAAGGALRTQARGRPQQVKQLDDTDLDALAAQVRSYPPLPESEVHALLDTVRAHDDAIARERLVQHHLRIALDEAIARGDRGIEVLDLYQEGSIATIIAINEYAARFGSPAGLRTFVTRVVGAHLDRTLEEAELERQSEEAFIRDARVYETAEIGLRHELGRSPTPTELAAMLEWPEERVELVGHMLENAREMYDSEIVQYLDDVSRDEE